MTKTQGWEHMAMAKKGILVPHDQAGPIQNRLLHALIT